jgi:sec-independent protein translocase protein TatB
MFGIGFTELLLISIIAILFLGPEKLPDAMVQIAKFIKSVKNTVNDAKGVLEEEMKVADLKDEALSYKKQLDSATNKLQGFKNIDIEDILTDEPKEESKKETKKVEVEPKNETVTFKKKESKEESK